ncbi:MAG: RNA-binding protein [Patescibacteria group bacterium]
MEKNLFVGNLPFKTTGDDLKNMFAQAGEVVSASVISDKFSGRSRGFGFVEMADEDGAQAAIKMFSNYDIEGRKLVVNEARPRQEGGRRSNFDRN